MNIAYSGTTDSFSCEEEMEEAERKLPTCVFLVLRLLIELLQVKKQNRVKRKTYANHPHSTFLAPLRLFSSKGPGGSILARMMRQAGETTATTTPSRGQEEGEEEVEDGKKRRSYWFFILELMASPLLQVRRHKKEGP